MNPFFIVGCGRSGTTLLRAMVDSHPEIAVPFESLFIPDYLRSKKPLRALKKSLVKEYELKEWGLSLSEEDLEGCRSKAQLIERIHRLYSEAHGKEFWGQKTPRLVRYGPLLKKYFPKARFIHVVRDPRAVASSLRHSDVHRSNALYAARRWKRDVGSGLRLDPVLEVTYESLIANPERELKRVCKFLGVEYDAHMLTYTTKKDDYGEFFDAIHKRLSEQPDTSRIDAWRKTMKPRDVAIVESETKGLMARYGYEQIGCGPSKVYIVFLRFERFLGFARQLFAYVKSRKGYLWCFARRKVSLGLIKDIFLTRYFS